MLIWNACARISVFNNNIAGFICVFCRNVGRPIRLQEQVFAVNEPFDLGHKCGNIPSLSSPLVRISSNFLETGSRGIGTIGHRGWITQAESVQSHATNWWLWKALEAMAILCWFPYLETGAEHTLHLKMLCDSRHPAAKRCIQVSSLQHYQGATYGLCLMTSHSTQTQKPGQSDETGQCSCTMLVTHTENRGWIQD